MPHATINDVELYYELNGDEAAEETIVFLNGVMASASSWAYYADFFTKRGYRVLLHDFKGQLRSGKPEGPYTFRMHSEDTIALMASLGIEKAHLIGTSYGGEVAMRMALDHPKAVRSLSIISSVSELDSRLEDQVERWKKLARTYDAGSFMRGLMPDLYSDTFIDAERANLEDRIEAMQGLDKSYYDGQIILYDTFLNDVTMTEELPKINHPALVVCGEKDRLKSPKFSHIIHENIIGSEYVLLPDTGHVAIFEKPKELTTLLYGFLRKHKIQ